MPQARSTRREGSWTGNWQPPVCAPSRAGFEHDVGATQIAAGDELRGLILLLRKSCERRAVNHVSDRARFDVVTAGHVIETTVIRDRSIASARDRIGIKLKKNPFHVGVLD